MIMTNMCAPAFQEIIIKTDSEYRHKKKKESFTTIFLLNFEHKRYNKKKNRNTKINLCLFLLDKRLQAPLEFNK